MAIEEIQQEVAVELGYGSWYAVQHSLKAFNSKKWLDTMYKKVVARYALKVAEKIRQDCADNAKMTYHDGHGKINHSTIYHQMGADNIQIDKQSILQTPIILP